jgi:hypothetical protein
MRDITYHLVTFFAENFSEIKTAFDINIFLKYQLLILYLCMNFHLQSEI